MVDHIAVSSWWSGLATPASFKAYHHSFISPGAAVMTSLVRASIYRHVYLSLAFYPVLAA
jgi:hypothetical protein